MTSGGPLLFSSGRHAVTFVRDVMLAGQLPLAERHCSRSQLWPLTIEEEQFDLMEGAGATFDRTRQHMHEPLNRVGPKDLPPLLLHVQSD